MLYGAVNVSQPKAPEFFKEVTAGLKQLQEEKKLEEATEKAARASMGDPSDANFATTWDSIGGAQQEAAQQLLEMKDELIKTEEGRALYQTYLDEIDQLGKLGEEDYKITFAVADNNMKNLMTGVEYEGRMQDSKTLSDYEDQMSKDDNRNRYSVRFEGGHLVLDDGSGAMRINDPNLFKATRYDANLERIDPVKPDTFYRRNAYRPYITTRDQAVQAVQDELASSKRNRLDAIEWWLRTDPAGQAEAKDGLTADKILAESQGGSMSDVLESYTDAAVEGWEKMTAEKKDKKDKKDKKKKTKYDLSDYNDSFEEEIVSKMQDLTVETYPEGFVGRNTEPEFRAVGRKVILEKPIDLGPYKISKIAFDGRTEDITLSLMDEYNNPVSIVLDKDGVPRVASKIFNSQGEPTGKEGNVIDFPTDPSINEGAYDPVGYFDAKYGEGSFSALRSILAMESAISKGSDVEDLLDGFNE